MDAFLLTHKKRRNGNTSFLYFSINFDVATDNIFFRMDNKFYTIKKMDFVYSHLLCPYFSASKGE